MQENEDKLKEVLTVASPTGEPIETLSAKVPEWQTVISEEEVSVELKKFQAEVNRKVAENKKKRAEGPPRPPAPPVDIEISKISRDGKVDMDFNQPLIPPTFGGTQDEATGRLLMNFDQLNVARDVVDIKFISKNGEEDDKLEYSLVIEDWTPEKLRIFVNFTNPTLVSNGGIEDSMIFKIQNPDLFRSAESGEPITEDRGTMI